MHLWLLFCLLASFMGSWVPTLLAQGGFEDCCLRYHSNISWRVLRHSRYYLRQDVSGSCNLAAVIFYLPWKGQIVCGNPQDRGVQRAMGILNARMKAGHISQKALHGLLQVGKKKMNSEKLKDSSHKRKAFLRNSRAVTAAKKTHNNKLLRTVSVSYVNGTWPL